MFKKLLILFLLPAFLFSAESITKSYTFSSPVVVNETAKIKGCITIPQTFVPSVPIRYVQLLLPKGYEAKDIEIIYGEKVALSDNHYLKPVIPPVMNKDPKVQINMQGLRSSVYTKNEDFPGAPRSYSKFSTQFMNGHAVLITGLHPVQYNPVSEKIHYFKNIAIKVNLQPQKRASSMPYICTPAIKARLGSVN